MAWQSDKASADSSNGRIYAFYFFISEKYFCSVYHKSHLTTNNIKQQTKFVQKLKWQEEWNKRDIRDCYFPPTPSKIRKFALKHKYVRTAFFLEFLCWSLVHWIQHIWRKTTCLGLTFTTASLTRCQQNPTHSPRAKYLTSLFEYKTYQTNHLSHTHKVYQKAVNRSP